MRHEGVPYRSQWAGLACNEAVVVRGADPCATGPWRSLGFTDPDEYRFWSGKVCGLACLESALSFWGVGHPDRATLLAEATGRGVYVPRPDGTVHGLVYRPFLDWVSDRFGVTGDLLEGVPLAELAGAVTADTLAMASVSAEIRWPDRVNARRGGHLVLVHGAADDRVWFHNPSGLAGTAIDAGLAMSTMDRFFAGRGMVLRRPATPGRGGVRAEPR